MRLKYKGIYKNESQLPKADLPPDAVPFREPKNAAMMNVAACLMMIPILAIMVCIWLLSIWIDDRENVFVLNSWNIFGWWIGWLLSLVMILPHELLHGICFGKDAEVELYFAPKQMMAFVVSTVPMTKARFIFLSMLPNLLFGCIPFLIWAFIPLPMMAASILFGFSSMSILMGCGDYVNVWNALRQMPKGSLTQLSGFHSYWFPQHAAISSMDDHK